MKKILLLTTGGTIASENEGDGLRPGISSEGLPDAVPGLRRRFDITTVDLLNLDSSNIQPEEWQTIAQAAFRALPDYDGIVITHGTDTMAYTASMLSYMLKNVTKPVILTGSQMPIDRLLSDARGNLAAAFAEYRPRLLALAEKRLNPILLKRMSAEDVLSEAYANAARRLSYFAAHGDVPIYYKLRTILMQTLADIGRRHLKAQGRDAYREAESPDPGDKYACATPIDDIAADII